MRSILKFTNSVLCLLLLCSCTAEAEELTEEDTQEVTQSVLLAHRDISTISTTEGIVVEREAESTVLSTQKTIYQTAQSISGNQISWLAAETNAGSPEMEIKYYDVTYSNDGEVLSKTYVLGADEHISATPRVLTYGATMAVNTYFRPSFSRYGLDCAGCKGEYTKSGNTGLGIKLDGTLGVQQADGTWKEGITWEGYYIVAASPEIPYCSILEISNHNYSGAGLSPNQPFYAIVLDRGGAIKNNRLDFYIGLEGNLNKNVKVVSKRTPIAKIIRLGGVIKKNGSYSCKV